MTDVASLVAQARAAAAAGASDPTRGGGGDPRARLAQLAAEFESTLLVQMLKDMRRSGSWGEDEKEGGLGAESLFDTIDAELARHLSAVQGLGLGSQLTAALDRLDGKAGAAAGDPAVPSGIPTPSTTRPLLPPEATVDRTVPQTASPLPSDAGVSLGSAVVTSPFGWRQDPFTGQAKFHGGVDIRAAYGQDVAAAGAGRVVFSGQQGAYGTTVVIEHANGMRTRYAHLSETLVSAGDDVGAGFAVGRAGRSGRATGTHLHFEVTGPDGRTIAPARGLALVAGSA